MQEIFKGFKQVKAWEDPIFERGYIYFVRTTEDGLLDGYIYFNGKTYGTGYELRELIGTLPSGETSVVEFIENLIDTETARTESTYAKPADISDAIDAETARTESTYAKPADVESAVTSAIEDETARTESTYVKKSDYDEDMSDIADEFADVYSAITDTVESAINEETARTESTYAKKTELDEAVSGITDELSSIEIDVQNLEDTKVESVNGKTGTTVTIDAGDIEYSGTTVEEALDDLYEAIAQTNTTVTGSSTVNATEPVSGVQTLSVNVSVESGNTIEVKEDGLFAAIYYEDDDFVEG